VLVKSQSVSTQSRTTKTSYFILDQPFTPLPDYVPHLVSSPNCIDQSQVIISSSSPLPWSDGTGVVPSCRESEENDSSLSVVLDSLLPFIRDNKSIVPLPVYLGKFVYDDPIGGGKANTSGTRVEGTGKEFAWSRGLGIEHSPIKTRSSRKKLAGVTNQTCDIDPSATDCGALRAMKALAREK
jgi:hypothetical protein